MRSYATPIKAVTTLFPDLRNKIRQIRLDLLWLFKCCKVSALIDVRNEPRNSMQANGRTF